MNVDRKCINDDSPAISIHKNFMFVDSAAISGDSFFMFRYRKCMFEDNFTMSRDKNFMFEYSFFMSWLKKQGLFLVIYIFAQKRNPHYRLK